MYRSDAEFYASYDWCLNPLLTLASLRQRIREELDRREDVETPWQQEESTINLYLLICAACCTVDDYLAFRPYELEAAVRGFPRLSPVIGFARAALNVPYALRTRADRNRIRRWRRDLVPCVDAVSAMLVAESGNHREPWVKLRAALQPVLNAQLPAGPLHWRTCIPEAFRCQDLSHHDVIEMAKRFVASQDVAPRSFVVLAPRTAGAYFAPLFKAYLVSRGISAPAWLTLRPKQAVSSNEKRELRRLVSTGACAVIIDDHPNTGRTLMMMASLVRRFGGRPDNIVIIAPDHPAQLTWTNAVHPISTVTLPHSEFYKQKLLHDNTAVGSILRLFYSELGWEDVRLESSTQLDALNAELTAHYQDGFLVRVKRVFDVRLARAGQRPISTRVIAKSVGWGWLGYHAYIAAERLRGFVPPMIGLRQGLLFTEWIGPLELAASPPRTERISAIVPSYVAARVSQLRLPEDPCFGSVGYRWTGWDRIASILRQPYGLYLGRIMAGTVRRRLREYLAPSPTMVDGRMTLSNWVEDSSGVYKSDFEQHNFGGAEPDIVDPAYDLAAAIQYLDLPEDDEQQLVGTYERLSGDDSIRSRILLYKLLHSAAVMDYAVFRLYRNPSSKRGAYLNHLYLSARDFLTCHANRHTATTLGELQPAIWSDRLIFLDLDGVLEIRVFGDFPQTTPDSLLALRLLRSNGYSAVLNTGRSVKHVRNYCRTFALPGGIAEYGSVFVDNVARREVGLVDPEALEQIRECRERIQQLPGVFTDPTCHWIVRAYRYTDRDTLGLPDSDTQRVLASFKSDRLRVIARDEDTCFVSKKVTKGTGLSAVKQSLQTAPNSVVAVGASAEDLDMLRSADIAYILAHASSVLKPLKNSSNCRSIRKARQKGLLAAVEDLLGDATSIRNQRKALRAAGNHQTHIVDEFLYAASRPRCYQLVHFLKRRNAPG